MFDRPCTRVLKSAGAAEYRSCLTLRVTVHVCVTQCTRVYSEVFQGTAESALPRSERELKVPHIHCLNLNVANLATSMHANMDTISPR